MGSRRRIRKRAWTSTPQSRRFRKLLRFGEPLTSTQTAAPFVHGERRRQGQSMALSASERSKRYQAKSKEDGSCTICTEPARLRKDGKPSIYCARHHHLKDARDLRRKDARNKQRRLARRAWLDLIVRLTGRAKCTCSLCGTAGHNRAACPESSETTLS